MSKNTSARAEGQKATTANSQILPPSAPKERKVSQAKKAIQEAAKYENSTTPNMSTSTAHDDYEASKVSRKGGNRMTEDDKKEVEALNNWGHGGGDDDDDDDF